MTTVRELVTKFGLDFDAQSFDRAHAAVDLLKGAAVRLAGVIAVGTIARGIKHTITETMDLADETSKAATKLGLTTQALQEMQFAGDLAGVSAGELDRSLSLLIKRAGDAALGDQEAADSFAEIGLSVKDAKGKIKGTDVLVAEIADKMKSASSETERLRIAMEFFGAKGGGKFVALLKDGAEGLASARAEALELGGVFSDDFAKTSEEVNDNFTRMQFAVQGAKVAFVSELLPSLIETTKEIISWIKANRDLIKSVGAGTKSAVMFGLRLVAFMRRTKAVQKALLALAAVVAVKLAAAVGLAVVSIGGVVAGLNAWAIAALLTRIQTAALAALTYARFAAVGAIFLLLAGLIGLIAEEIAAFATETDGLFERMAGKWGELKEALLESASGDDPWYISLLKFLGVLIADVFDKVDRFTAAFLDAIIAIGDFADDVAQFYALIPVWAKKAAYAAYDFFAERAEAIKQVLMGIVSSTPLGKALGLAIDAGSRLIGAQPTIGATPAVQAAAANRQATANTSVSVQVDASGQSLDEGQLSSMLTRQVTEALTTANRDAAFALTPALAGG